MEDWFKKQATEQQSAVCTHTHAHTHTHTHTHTQDRTLFTIMYFEVIGLQAIQILFLILSCDFQIFCNEN